MFRRLTIFAVLLMFTAVLSAQKLDRTVANSIARYFKEYTSDRSVTKFSALDKRRNNIIVSTRPPKITIYCNEGFYGQPFTPAVVERIYADIRALLPAKYRKYRIDVVYKGKSIEDCIPNIYRKKGVDKERLWRGVEYDGEPWVRNVSRPFDPEYGLVGRHLSVGQSHGRCYSVGESAWRWQRPSLFCTVEDLFTQSIVVPFLMPMLENAGAVVYTPRERDWQRNCVIVDNDIQGRGSEFREEDGKKNSWQCDTLGYAPRKEVYSDGENPFAMGSSLLVGATSSDSRAEASAAWYPSIPEDGEYAVYVSYRTHGNSVPDARYTVMHAGGETVYEVNQRMGGGTWVYLGRHTFRAGRDMRQGVRLTSESGHEGVVSADAVRFGGGMGNVVRGDSLPTTSGLPRYLEGARYNLQTGGFPIEVYSTYNGENDYRDDINCRSHAVNYLSGGSVYNPDTTGLNVPIELALGFHSDAGYSASDGLVGTVGVVTTAFNGDTLEAGRSRYMSRDLVSYMLNNLQDDLGAAFSLKWPIRGVIDRNYSESRLPAMPSVIFESLSHQNYKDLVYGFDPNFKFAVARSVYKSLLKHLCYVHGEKYVVQPLPVKEFSVRLSSDCSEAVLRWSPVEDPSEPTAKPTAYIVYTRVGDGGFDNGVVVSKPRFTMPVERNTLYSFKVAALNDGGCSMPSETLALNVSGKVTEQVLVVNGFHRLGAPYSVETESKVGFDMEIDPGVAYMCTPEYCGNQYDLLRENIAFENGLGLSGSEYEGRLIAGNTLDYPYVHGRALVANGISFVSCGSDAVISGDVRMADYAAVDIILGTEKQGGRGSALFYDAPYKTFPRALQEKVGEYCNGGGALLVSGAYIASDMVSNAADRDFLRRVLRFDYGGSVYDTAENMIYGSGLLMPIRRGVNERCYAVPRTDILVPIDDAFVSFVYDGNRKSAGVAYAGDYRVLSLAFPFEAVADEEKREKLMGSAMRFLLK